MPATLSLSRLASVRARARESLDRRTDSVEDRPTVVAVVVVVAKIENIVRGGRETARAAPNRRANRARAEPLEVSIVCAFERSSAHFSSACLEPLPFPLG